MNRKRLTLWYLAAVLFVAASPSEAAAPGRGIRILTSVFPLKEFAAAVIGDRGEATLLLPPGAGVHTWQPRPGDLVRLAKCDLFIYIGADLEPWLPGLMKGLAARRPATLEASAGLDLLPGAKEAGYAGAQHGHGPFAPHVWLDPDLAVRIVATIRDRLTALDPEGGPVYLRNAAALEERLRDLDARYREGLRGCSGKAIILAGHAAFGYLAHRYGLEQIALYGTSPDSQPTPAELIEVVNKARARGIKSVFTENSASPALARSLSRELGVRTLVLNPGHNLTRAEMRAGTTFFDIMETNLRSLEDGLGCR
ncbi:MAG TPA: zinc ABC transporter substrate-binding protein [Acidobacteriota bacterium]|nr:zinc ABC transporter substrate-binding protein [Acidobacteriota bacterium]